MKPVRSIEQRSKIFFHGRRAKLRDQVAAHFHFWCLKRKRKVAEGNCKRVQWGVGQAAREENSQSARRIDFLRINNFLPRAQSWRAVTKYRPRKKVGRETLTRRARSVRPSIHPPLSSKRETYFRSARAQTCEDGVYRKPRRRKQFFEYSTGILKKLFS